MINKNLKEDVFQWIRRSDTYIGRFAKTSLLTLFASIVLGIVGLVIWVIAKVLIATINPAILGLVVVVWLCATWVVLNLLFPSDTP